MYICIYIHTYTYYIMHRCVCLYACMDINAYITDMHVCVHKCMHTYMDSYIHTCMCIYNK